METEGEGLPNNIGDSAADQISATQNTDQETGTVFSDNFDTAMNIESK